MKANFFSRLFSALRGRPQTNMLATTPEIVATEPRGLAKAHPLTAALNGMNDEFVTLNSKLLELKDALGNLRDALKKLEEANRHRAQSLQTQATSTALVINRKDLN